MEMKEVKSKSGKTVYFLVDSNGLPIDDVFNYICYLVKNNNSSNTAQSYCYRLKIFFEWLELNNYNHMDIIKPKKTTTNALYDKFTDFKLWLMYPDLHKGITPIKGYEQKRDNKTVNQILNTVFCFYDYILAQLGEESLPVYKKFRNNSSSGKMLSEMYITKKESTRCIFNLPVKEKVPDSVTYEEYELCYQNASNRRNRVIIGLMFEAALRVSEVINLKLEDLKDLYKNQIHIVLHEDLDNKDAAVKYQSEGTVFISNRLRDEIITYINETHTVIDTNYLVFNLYGDTKYQPMSRDNIEDMVERLGKKVGIKKLHPHAFRHGCAVFMLDNNVPMEAIKDFLRHKNVHTTEKIYAKLSTHKKKEIMKTYYKEIDKSFNENEYAKSLAELLKFLETDKEN